MNKYLVTGGAGFVGSHLVALLSARGHQVTVVDNLITGHANAVIGANFIKADIGDTTIMDNVLSDGPWDAVFHFAALSLVGESMREPFLYFHKNTALSASLIEQCIKHKINKFIFSSTAALFGNPSCSLIDENCPVQPMSPYGESKLMVERMLHWADEVHGMKSACLRYFNAAGADILGRLGEDHNPETHLVPIVIDAALGRRAGMDVFGNDYNTPDGTAVRDYIHVDDLAEAHLMAANIIDNRSVKYNLGTGTGSSVMEIIKAVSKISGKKVDYTIMQRRAGDPAILVANPTLIRQQTGWHPHHSSINNIVETALRWREIHPNGYL